MNRRNVIWAAAISVLITGSMHVDADEGMWLFNRLPLEQLEAKHGFKPGDGWARRVMRSSVRISSGGSGSVISPDGLVLTNHHVASTFIQELSSAEHNYLEEGFFARSRDEELRCPNAEILIVWEIEDVTSRIRAAVKDGMDAGAAERARRAEIALTEKESKDASGLHSEIVSLFRGGEYHLYRYRRYDDIRLVMAPEVDVAFFGGDADNFEYPRYCLDMAFLRIYENGKPAKLKNYLPWSRGELADGDLIFVSGNPGSTQRLNTVDHLRFYRDVAYPEFLRVLYRREIALQQFSLRSPEARRLARDALFSIQNSRKAVRGILSGLFEPDILGSKLEAEARLKARVAASPELGASLGDWRNLRNSMIGLEEMYRDLMYIERGRAFWSTLFSKAKGIVRLVEEVEKPLAERLPAFRDAALPRYKLSLFSAAPIDKDLEIAKLTDSLTDFSAAFGAEHPLVQSVLDGSSPAGRAYELVSKSELLDVEHRKKLVAGGVKAVKSSNDPMIQLALRIDGRGRALQRQYESTVKGVQTESYANISRAKFKIEGNSVYPDATFTLRLAFGVVKSWTEGGREVPAFTDIAGSYAKNVAQDGKDPYELPATWLAAKDRVRGSTAFNFVSTVDIIGGNSGSPVVDRKGELVGLIFDGNIHGLILDIAYTDEKARAVSVDARAIIETLEKTYKMKKLVNEILGR